MADRPADHARGELPGAGRRRRSPEGGDAGAVRAAGRADGADQPGGQHPVLADPVHRREDRQRVLHQRAARRRVPLARRRHVRAVHAHAVGRRWCRSTPSRSIKRGSGPVIINRKYLQRIIDVTANVAPGKDLGGASQAVQRVLDELPPPEGFTVRLGGQTEAQQTGVRRPVVRGDPGRAARLHGAGVAVQVADRSAGDHVQRAAGRDGRVPGAVADRHDAVREQLHGHHHDGRHRGVERRAAGRLRERVARPRQAADRGDRSRPGGRGCARS